MILKNISIADVGLLATVSILVANFGRYSLLNGQFTVHHLDSVWPLKYASYSNIGHLLKSHLMK